MQATRLLLATLLATPLGASDLPPLLDRDTVHALSEEISGELAKRNLERLVVHHRMRGSDGFEAAVADLHSRLRGYGLGEVEILELPADGEIFYGTQRSRPPWNAQFAELREIRDDGEVLIASWDAMPMRLAQDSVSAALTARLVDVGAGTSESNYAGRDVKGAIVMTSSQPGAIADLAVGRYGAAGIVSWAQNQRTAWWGENEELVRWGHLDTFSEHPTFAFMLSPGEARALMRRLEAGETITLQAEVRAGLDEGGYDVLTATIPGESDEEIAYSCHLDHPRPGANDNASGCAALLEIARVFAKLIDDGALERPKRTIRFVWPPEIEGTLAFLVAHPEIAANIRAAIHLDMVGGGPETKATFHVTRGPASLPSFINDLSQEIGRWVNDQTAELAAGGTPLFPLVESTGGKEPLRAEMVELTMGSDHQIYTEGSFRIPAVYLNDWPDRYIHTTWDTAANIDPTKLRRAAFIAAATGWALANLDEDDVPEVLEILGRNAVRRTASMMERRGEVDPAEAANLTRFHSWYERELVRSIEPFAPIGSASRAETEEFLDQLDRLTGAAALAGSARETSPVVYRRNRDLPGPMTVFGYDYLEAHYGKEKTANLALLRIAGGRRGSGADYAYEALNLVDGRRSVREIRDMLSAIYGPVPFEAVAEYLDALESIDVVRR
ncbi:MAG: DUF4910 domain-containing protein [Acidobacteria bacterium]|nr:DUF4910 domain-containing protein [Acidobacteriota bacterium]